VIFDPEPLSELPSASRTFAAPCRRVREPPRACSWRSYDALCTVRDHAQKHLVTKPNNNHPSKCSAMNNGQNEIGSGGNGGALYSDGNSVSVLLCGDEIDDNATGMGAFGGGLFFTSNDMMSTLTITDTTMTGNTGGHWTNVSTGSVTNAGTAIGTNAKSIAITNSMLQGVP
jgi:hypothetical protein